MGGVPVSVVPLWCVFILPFACRVWVFVVVFMHLVRYESATHDAPAEAQQTSGTAHHWSHLRGIGKRKDDTPHYFVECQPGGYSETK